MWQLLKILKKSICWPGNKSITEKRLVLNDLVYNIFVLSDLTLIRNETLSIDSVYPNFIFTIQSQLICQSQNQSFNATKNVRLAKKNYIIANIIGLNTGCQVIRIASETIVVQ